MDISYSWRYLLANEEISGYAWNLGKQVIVRQIFGSNVVTMIK